MEDAEVGEYGDGTMTRLTNGPWTDTHCQSGVMGGGMGIFMGMLFGALQQPVAGDTMTARQHFVHAARTMSTKSAKTFAVMGAIFAGTEWVFEKARAKHDTTNTVLAGCATGGSLSARDSLYLTASASVSFVWYHLMMIHLKSWLQIPAFDDGHDGASAT